jgi:hypothetical protein
MTTRHRRHGGSRSGVETGWQLAPGFGCAIWPVVVARRRSITAEAGSYDGTCDVVVTFTPLAPGASVNVRRNWVAADTHGKRFRRAQLAALRYARTHVERSLLRSERHGIRQAQQTALYKKRIRCRHDADANKDGPAPGREAPGGKDARRRRIARQGRNRIRHRSLTATPLPGRVLHRSIFAPDPRPPSARIGFFCYAGAGFSRDTFAFHAVLHIPATAEQSIAPEGNSCTRFCRPQAPTRREES